MTRPTPGILLAVAGSLMATLAAALLLYTAAIIFSRSLLPALEVSQPELASAVIMGMDFSGFWVLVPLSVYLLMGFVALALAARQGRRAIVLWRGGSASSHRE